MSQPLRLALAGLEARVPLVDDIDAAFAPNHAAFLVSLLQGLQRTRNAHDPVLWPIADYKRRGTIGARWPPVNGIIGGFRGNFGLCGWRIGAH